MHVARRSSGSAFASSPADDFQRVVAPPQRRVDADHQVHSPCSSGRSAYRQRILQTARLQVGQGQDKCAPARLAARARSPAGAHARRPRISGPCKARTRSWIADLSTADSRQWRCSTMRDRVVESTERREGVPVTPAHVDAVRVQFESLLICGERAVPVPIVEFDARPAPHALPQATDRALSPSARPLGGALPLARSQDPRPWFQAIGKRCVTPPRSQAADAPPLPIPLHRLLPRVHVALPVVVTAKHDQVVRLRIDGA